MDDQRDLNLPRHAGLVALKAKTASRCDSLAAGQPGDTIALCQAPDQDDQALHFSNLRDAAKLSVYTDAAGASIRLVEHVGEQAGGL